MCRHRNKKECVEAIPYSLLRNFEPDKYAHPSGLSSLIFFSDFSSLLTSRRSSISQFVTP